MPVNKSEYSKKYYQEHKDIMKNQMKQRLQQWVTCTTCNQPVSKASLFQHKKTKKHLTNLEHPKTNEMFTDLQFSKVLRKVMTELALEQLNKNNEKKDTDNVVAVPEDEATDNEM